MNAPAAIRTHNLILSSAGSHSDGIWVRGACWGIRHTLEASRAEADLPARDRRFAARMRQASSDILATFLTA